MINQVFNEDCLEGMSRIADKSVDMILCDLPYGTTACKWDVIIPFEPLWKQYERVIKDSGAIVLTASQPFTSILVSSNIKLFRHEWIWKKNVGSNFLNVVREPMKEHESAVVFSKGGWVYNQQKIERKDKERVKYGYKDNGKREQYGKFAEGVRFIDDKELRCPSSVVECNVERGLHPTQKPVALFEYLIKTYTNEGETVLDNCMGSGTTAIACINTGRNYIGFEKEEKYFKIIQDRIKNHTPQLKLIA